MQLLNFFRGQEAAAKVETGFTAASQNHKAMALWTPKLWRIDEMVNEKGAIESRILDVARNNASISGAIRTQVDGIVGSRFRLALRPDNRMLGVGRERIKAWVNEVEAEWTAYAESPECWIDARRERTFTDIIRMAVSQDIYHGEFMATKEWLTSPLGYKTAFQVVDPTRVDTPDRDSERFPFGIRRTGVGAAAAYSVRVGKASDPLKEYRVVPKYNRFGWLQFIHVYDPMRPDQSRGVSRLAAALSTVKQLDRFHETELEQSIIAASYAMFIKSHMPDIDQVFGNGGLTSEYQSYLEARNQHYSSKPVTNNGATVGHLMPGEEVETVNIAHPSKAFDSFIASNSRMIARSLGLSYEEYSGDLSKVAYASARVALLLTERFNAVKRETIAKRAANLMFRIWLDEAVDRGRVSPPVDYWSNRSALSKADWISGTGGHVDDLKTARARKVNLETGVQTHQEIAAQDGYDWEERLEQRKTEAQAIIKAVEEIGGEVTSDMKAKIMFGSLSGQSVDPELISADIEAAQEES